MPNIKEHDMVRLLHYRKGLPENAIGIVVHIYGDHEGYEVEFSGCWYPHSTRVETLMPNEIERIPDGRSK